MSLQLIVSTFTEDGRVTLCLCIFQDHRLIEEIEAIHIFNSASRGIHTIEDNEGLALRLDILFGDNLNHIAEVGEDLLQGDFELFNLNALL